MQDRDALGRAVSGGFLVGEVAHVSGGTGCCPRSWGVAPLVGLLAVLLLLCGLLAVPGTAQAAAKGTWVEKGSHTYLYLGSEKATGWQKVSGRTYYFDARGRMATNAIAGTKATGCHYVNPKGHRVYDKATQEAVDFVLKYTKKSWSRAKKLKACYKVLWKSYPYRGYADAVSRAKLPSYARCVFEKRNGNCYRSAAAFAYVARVLGYEARVGVGKVASGPWALTRHGWTEVKVKGAWLMCDISMQRPRPGTNLYQLTRSQYPFRLKVAGRYTLKVNGAKASWR